MCLAINIGDLKGLERLLSSKPDLVCDRGPFGETILHVAILKKKADIAEWIIERYGDDYIPVLQESLQVTEIRLCEISYGQGVKVDGTPYGHQYNGETALHQACKNGMLTVVKLLVDKKVNANVEANGISFQEYSTSWEYPNLYSGSTPLHFAATRRDTLEIIKLLVEKGGADIYRKDQYGNNILHVMAYFGIFNETYQYIVKRNDADLMKGVTKTKLITQDNNHGLTPAMLGLSLGYCSMIEALKEPQWEFGDDIGITQFLWMISARFCISEFFEFWVSNVEISY
ncbi:ankyrin [Rhizoclosmatium globosum]|uniref:Ankyrin n=1 Tax=Rhizoclosmatium globosum TaxID=329046 RepID=A0A1Y2CFU6_9FUNG|nr:ankyrin [Rhizoclosmatium globosum]|eukprot:ORY45921.1 ankyrin [Rhizoclosmatium globosum]